MGSFNVHQIIFCIRTTTKSKASDKRPRQDNFTERVIQTHIGILTHMRTFIVYTLALPSHTV